MVDAALNAAATAMTDLANALDTGSEKSLIHVEFFKGDGTQDPEQWLQEYRRAAVANKWTNARKLELAPVYLKGVALDQYQNLPATLTAFDDYVNANTSFKHVFRAHFYTTKQRALWQKQLFEIKQGTDSVDTYVNRFRELKKRVDAGNVFPANFLIQLFIQGL